MKLINRHWQRIVCAGIIIGMLCTVCCTAFFGCGRKQEADLIIAGTEEGTEESIRESTEGTGVESITGEIGSEEVLSGTETAVRQEETGDSLRDSPVVVYICGEVKQPGVYSLKAGARICDAVEAAGGMTEDAAEDYWNLAEKVQDGDMIYIPDRQEAEERDDSAADTSMSRSQGATGNSRTDVTSGSTGTSSGISSDGRININTADAEELTEIPGVGTTRAEAIIDYREKNGNFASIDEITKVSGIGDSLFTKMKDSITVD